MTRLAGGTLVIGTHSSRRAVETFPFDELTARYLIASTSLALVQVPFFAAFYYDAVHLPSTPSGNSLTRCSIALLLQLYFCSPWSMLNFWQCAGAERLYSGNKIINRLAN
jgi:hypothetical protein